MIDHDISTSDALRLLSQAAPDRDTDPTGWTRRSFLRAAAYGLGGAGVVTAADALGVISLIPGELRDAWGAQTVAPNEGILINVVMYGGNDGMNTLVPFTNGNYYRMRGGLAVPAAQVLQLNASVGLAPQLPFLRKMFAKGDAAIVQGVGYANPNFSHFSSMATWMRGTTAPGGPVSGWIGRWLDGIDSFDSFRACTVGQTVPLHLQGQTRRATGIPEAGDGFGTNTESWDKRLYTALREYSAAGAGRGAWHDATAGVIRTQLDVASTTKPIFARALPEDEITRKMTLAARLVNADLGLRVLDVGWGDFDSHNDQPSMHPARMAEFDAALRSFFTNLDDRWRSRVTMVVWSEFGRTPWANGSRGTDHGASNCVFVLGSGVKGGLYGAYPSLAGLQRWDSPAGTTDFRSVFATVLDQWMGGGGTEVTGSSARVAGLFDAAPGAGVATGTGVAPQAGKYVPVTPFRIHDTRTGLGGRYVPVGEQAVTDVQASGRGGVPKSGVTAVVMNVAVTRPTADSYATAYPHGEKRPVTSALNYAAGQTVPNMVMMRLGAGGRVSIANNTGTVECIADVVGYYSTTGGDGFAPTTPTRILDTRTVGKVGAGKTLNLDVRAKAGAVLPANTSAVVLSVSAFGATAASFLTIFPRGVAKPTAANLNYVAGTPAANLVVMGLGAGGISMFNSAGAVDLTVDLLGYFAPTARGSHVAVGPVRILETRPKRNVGAPAGAKGAAGVNLKVLGAGGVPASGVSAVVLNVAVTQPSVAGFVTVWPAGTKRPGTSNVQYKAGMTIPSLVVAKVGTGGGVMLAPNAGTTHLIADVVGYFT